MFYCQLCAMDNGWPESLAKSFGSCEVCGKARECNDRPSSSLPLPQKETATINPFGNPAEMNDMVLGWNLACALLRVTRVPDDVTDALSAEWDRRGPTAEEVERQILTHRLPGVTE